MSGNNQYLQGLVEEGSSEFAAPDCLERSDFAMVIESRAPAMSAPYTTSGSRLVFARYRIRGANNPSERARDALLGEDIVSKRT